MHYEYEHFRETEWVPKRSQGENNLSLPTATAKYVHSRESVGWGGDMMSLLSSSGFCIIGPLHSLFQVLREEEEEQLGGQEEQRSEKEEGGDGGKQGRQLGEGERDTQSASNAKRKCSVFRFSFICLMINYRCQL